MDGMEKGGGFSIPADNNKPSTSTNTDKQTRMDDMEKGGGLSTPADNNKPSTSTNTDTNAPKPRKRSPKTCKKCGRSVQNLSRHQKEVHKMTKMKRKLNGYFTGEKKTPSRRVKFCPLSPCKGLKTPIFQLHKHLQTRIHKLKPNSPRYLKALADAPRASIAKVDSYLKRQRKSRQEGKSNDDTKTQHTIEDDSSHSNDEQAGESETENEMAGEDVTHEKSVEHSQEDNTGYSDVEYEDFSGRVERKITSRRARGQRKKKAQGERTRNNMDSDAEYDQLASRVWKSHEDRRARSHDDVKETQVKRMKKSDKGAAIDTESEEKSKGRESEDKNVDNEAYKDFLHLVKVTASKDGTSSNKANDAIVISNSDVSSSDPEYVCERERDSEATSQSGIADDSSSLYTEREELLTELVEVVGAEKIEKGSFLDRDEAAWCRKVKEFKDTKIGEGHVFKTVYETAEELRRVYEDKEDSDDEAFQAMFDGDESDNDDALDTQWMPSDCEMDEQEASKAGTKEGGGDAVTEKFLVDFYKWLIDVDGGYRSTKMAQQYKSQVQSVIRRLKLDETFTKAVQPKPPALYLLLHPGRNGVKLLKTWLSYAVDKYQPGTVRSYLMSLRLFYKFLTQECLSDLPDVSVETVNSRRDYMTSWSAAQKKKVLKRKLEKYDEDYRKLLSSETLHQVCHGNQHVNAVKQLAETSQKINSGNDVTRTLSDTSHCEVRDWLMTRLLIDNSGRSGVAANMTTSEFQNAVYYPGTEEDSARYRVDVKNHKTAGVYGAANVWVYDNLYLLIDMYLRTVRSQFVTGDSQVDQVFVSSNGLALTSSQVSNCICRTFQREGIDLKGKICTTTIRKSLATGMHVHMPDQRDHLAALAQHKTQTQARYYRVHDKVNETDLGRRAVKKLVSLQTEDVLQAKKENMTSAAWTIEETQELQKLFQREVETGSIKEPEVNEKLVETSILKTHSLKAVVLKLRRMREEHVRNLEPPCEQLTSKEKVLHFLDVSEFQKAASASSVPSVSGESSRFFRKFTDEQTRHLLSLTKDLVQNNTIKKEVVWQRVVDDARALELGLITGNEDEAQICKAKQRLTDKVRQEANKIKNNKVTKKRINKN